MLHEVTWQYQWIQTSGRRVSWSLHLVEFWIINYCYSPVTPILFYAGNWVCIWKTYPRPPRMINLWYHELFLTCIRSELLHVFVRFKEKYQDLYYFNIEFWGQKRNIVLFCKSKIKLIIYLIFSIISIIWYPQPSQNSDFPLVEVGGFNSKKQIFIHEIYLRSCILLIRVIL